MDLNILAMFWDAGLVVKFVMLLLLLFSIISWGIIFMKFRLFKRVKNDSQWFLEQFWQSKNLAEAFNAAQECSDSPEAAVLTLSFQELQKLQHAKGTDSATSQADAGATLERQMATVDNLKRTLRKAQSLEGSRLSSYLAFLATTGSATPFIGLFGTVWGIMTSFHDIGMRGSASLAIVAPGISEALVATAAGLAVAIPAVIFYNYFSSKVIFCENEMDVFATDLLNLIERDLLSRKATQ